MKISSKDFRVPERDDVNLKNRPTKIDQVYKSKAEYQKLLEEHVAQLSSQRQLLYASNRHAVLLIFQAVDAAGKDGAIQHVISGVNPQGCQVFSYKHPSATELEHDFLWRTTRDLPERGRIGIFNDPIMRRYWSSTCIPRFSAAKQSRMPRIMTRRSGTTGIVRLWIWRNTHLPIRRRDGDAADLAARAPPLRSTTR
jgi:polyphosphate kinase 2 (PPK2 family)